jgi:nitroreductase
MNTAVTPAALLEFLKTRRSVREFLQDDVPEADVRQLIEAASWAPSGTNRQNWHFIAVRSMEVKDRMAAALKTKIDRISAAITQPQDKKSFDTYCRFLFFFSKAPLTIAVVQKPYISTAAVIVERYTGETYRSSAGVQGPAAAIGNLLLMALALGYGACWMTGPLLGREELEEVLGVKPPDELMALIPVGRYAAAPVPPHRKRVEEILEIK